MRNPPAMTAFAAPRARSIESVRITATEPSALIRAMTAVLSREAVASFIAKGRARHHRHVRFAEQSIGKILRRQSELTDIEQHIERTLRFDRSHIWNFGEAINHVIAAHVEFLAHVGDRLLIALQRGKRAPLRERGWIGRRMA